MNAHAPIELTGFQQLVAAGLDAYRADPPYTVSQWADKNRYLSTVSSAEPGRWRTSRAPYLREIMDCLSAYSPVEEVNVMKGVQIGMSEAGFNFVGYAIHHNPGPMMYVMPTIDMAKKFSKTRIDPMIEASPALKERIKPARARDSGNTVFSKDFDGGVLVITGANSGSGLRGLPVGKLVLDEVDGYPASADDDGDPVTLATDRTSTFKGRRKIFKLSTPTLKETSRIGRAFRQGDQRYYHVACEKCGTLQPITWAKIKWEPGRPETAAFVCSAADPETGELCEHRHPEHRKAELLREKGFGGKAEWIATAASSRPNLRSYHVSALYSPWYTWAECAFRFIAAKDDPALLQPFVNNVLGEEWEDLSGERVDPSSLRARTEKLAGCTSAFALLTAGLDVQPDRVEVEVVAWGVGEESWSLDYQIFTGDPSAQEVWDQVDDYLWKRWDHPSFAGGIGISAAAIDTGGSNTQSVYRFVRPREGRRIWGIKGYAGPRPVWPKRPSRNNKGHINLYPIGVDSAKEVVAARLARTGVSGPGACHFPDDRDPEYFEQLTAEVRKTRYVKGAKVTEWHQTRDRNEALDCRVYAYAALQGLISMGLHLNREAERVRKLAVERGEPEPAEAEDAPPQTIVHEDQMPDEPESSLKARAPAIRKKKRGKVIPSPYM